MCYGTSHMDVNADEKKTRDNWNVVLYREFQVLKKITTQNQGKEAEIPKS